MNEAIHWIVALLPLGAKLEKHGLPLLPTNASSTVASASEKEQKPRIFWRSSAMHIFAFVISGAASVAASK